MRFPPEDPYLPLPAGYGVGRAVALPVGPGRAFVFWELTAEAVGQARDRLGASASGSRLVLRCVEEDGEGTRYLDVRDWLGHRHVVGLSPGARVIAEVGYLAEDGRFAPALRAAPVELPRDAPGVGDVRWVRPAGAAGGGPERDVPAALREREEPVATPFDPASTVSS